MSRLVFDKHDDRRVENGVSHGVLFLRNISRGVAWNGLISVSENPDGADEVSLYADNIKYGSFRAAENYNATIEAYTYPDGFLACDGKVEPTSGVYIGQQGREKFDFSFRSNILDSNGREKGYLLHIIYNATASPSEVNYSTANDSVDAITFSWDITTLPFILKGYKPSSKITIDSTKVDKLTLKEIEASIYGDAEHEPYIPSPEELYNILERNDVIRPAIDVLSSHGHWIWDSFNFKRDNVPDAIEKESLRHIFYNPQEGTVYIQPSVAYTFISENSQGLRHYTFLIVDQNYPSQLALDMEAAMELEKIGTRHIDDFYYYSYDLYI